MKVEEIRKLSDQEILTKIKEDKEELFKLRFQLSKGELDKTSKLKDLRKEVARLKTILVERKDNE